MSYTLCIMSLVMVVSSFGFEGCTVVLIASVPGLAALKSNPVHRP